MNIRSLLLVVLYRHREPITATKLQKLLFLLKREDGIDANVAFVPHKFGPYSQMVTETTERLESEGLLSTDRKPNMSIGETDSSFGRAICLTSEGIHRAEIAYSLMQDVDKRKLDYQIGRWSGKPLASLILYVYLTYPDMTEKSVIRNKFRREIAVPE